MIFVRWNKSFTFTCLLLLYLNKAINAYINDVKDTNDVKIYKQDNAKNSGNNNHESVTDDGEEWDNDDNHADENDETENIDDMDKNKNYLNTANVIKMMQKYYVRKRPDNAHENDMYTGEPFHTAYLQKYKILKDHSSISNDNNNADKNVENDTNHPFDYIVENVIPFLLSKEDNNQTATGEDDNGEMDGGNGTKSNEEPGDNRIDKDSSKEQPKEKNERSDDSSSNSAHSKGDSPNKESLHEQTSHAETTPPSSKSSEGDTQKKEPQPPMVDPSEQIKKTLLKEGKDIKETTSLIDNAVYNVEQVILKTRFYSTAIRNFVNFKVNHICEYSKCGLNARCYIIDKDKEECRCRANYEQDTSVEYFKCKPMTKWDCTINNGNCDKNAECTIENERIKCQCGFNYFGDGIFCVMGSHTRQTLYILLIVAIILCQKIFF
ncbi:merozoite surface protein 10, putative (MSP10) [Plasmodium ovale wallikeri]|uniref:Merozoite surface protein 10, putative n=2 Tax=Plasmodium ovale TaxID=36330 RepID=A0A1C3KUC2_PLAOA|nr:merozoite surface protein 10, putative (MSP10) [Plasmodium ovale wallikeri]SBT38867.1 merozoite surface protein 10, putative (MSP10) [Plasmodium ovale wallikeri]SBT77719.1 merozoite surface protein 10, putative [Plasmodium ovale]